MNRPTGKTTVVAGLLHGVMAQEKLGMTMQVAILASVYQSYGLSGAFRNAVAY